MWARSVTLILSVVALILGASYSRSADAFRSGVWPPGAPPPKPTSNDNVLIEGGSTSFNKRVVGIFYVNEAGTGSICSGLWISDEFILTAKHCICHRNGYMVTNSTDMTGLQSAGLGAYWERATLAGQFGNACARERDMRIGVGDDIALLKLDPSGGGALENSRKSGCKIFSLVENIHFGSYWTTKKPVAMSVAGYGLDGSIPDSQEHRREATIQVNTLTCMTLRARSVGCAPLREFILGAGSILSRPFDSCGGDSGGPAYISVDGAISPIGLVSRGLPIAQPSALGRCGAGGIYTLLGRHDVIDWMTNKGVPSNSTDCSDR